MTTIIPSGNCGNSPKSLFAEQFSIGQATSYRAVLDSVTDDVEWKRVDAM